MDEMVSKLSECFNETIGFSYRGNCHIKIDDSESEIVLAANREGMLYLIKRLIELCEHNKEWDHYHLDEAGMASECNKPMVISLLKEN